MPKIYSTVFVFQAPIEKTNIQRGELISLIELDNENSVTEVLNNEAFYQTHKGKNEIITFKGRSIIKQKDYQEVKIIFFSQCAIVYSNYELDIKEITRRSGYIHSVGKLVFMTRWEIIDTEKILKILTDYCRIEKKVRKVVFYKSSVNEGIDNKLNNLLIDDLRYHIGAESFHNAEESIAWKLQQYFISQGITKPGKEPIFIFKDTAEVNDNSALSNFYSDRNIIEYSICYISTFKKDNSIHYLDDLKECKPFWAGIYTTPHRLMNAMLNLARVTKDSKVVDPFSHTGTLAIEASQIGCKVKAFDLHEILGAKDNYEFLCCGGKKILKTSKKLLNLSEDRILTGELQYILQNSIHLNKQGLPEVNEGKRIEDLVKNNKVLKKIENRLYFYLLRRYEMEKLRGAILDKSSAIDFAKKHVTIQKKPEKKKIESPTTISENFFNFFGKQLFAFENVNKAIGFPVIYLSEDSNKKYACRFTDSIYKTNRIGYINRVEEKPDFELKDILKNDYSIEESSIDAVVTDPPYGYGEDLNEREIKEIYAALFEKSFKWIKPLGFLVFCALDKVKTGRKKGLLFTEDIIEIANFVARKNNVYFNLNYFYPTQIQKTCLYFWKSKSALNRSIIVLRINK